MDPLFSRDEPRSLVLGALGGVEQRRLTLLLSDACETRVSGKTKDRLATPGAAADQTFRIGVVFRASPARRLSQHLHHFCPASDRGGLKVLLSFGGQ